MKTALSIAGTDPSGGAGLQADLKTFAAHGVYGMGAITAVVAQNTRNVFAVEKVSKKILEGQLEAVFGDIYPDAIKIGMIPDIDAISVIANVLRKYKPRHVVIDTVMISSSGHRLLNADAVDAFSNRLLPLASLITPNIPEAEVLCGFSIEKAADMERAAHSLCSRLSVSVLVKGGHLAGSCDDFLLHGGESRWFLAERIVTKNTHGTGCTLSSAIAANLALGFSMEESVKRAKTYLLGALSSRLSLGHGRGPLHHGWMDSVAKSADTE